MTRTWLDRLPDCPAFIIGNAPSLNECNLSLIEDYLTFGVNRAFLAIDPTILMWQDISLWNTESHRLNLLEAIKVSRDVSDPRKIYYNFYLQGSDYKFGSATHILHGRGSTGPLAVQLAVACGCRPIVLLGMDCQPQDDKTDFYGDNKNWTDQTVKNCYKGLQFVQQQCPVEVYSCGKSDLWPRQSLEEVLEQIDPRHKRSRKSYVRQLLQLPEK